MLCQRLTGRLLVTLVAAWVATPGAAQPPAETAGWRVVAPNPLPTIDPTPDLAALRQQATRQPTPASLRALTVGLMSAGQYAEAAQAYRAEAAAQQAAGDAAGAQTALAGGAQADRIVAAEQELAANPSAAAANELGHAYLDVAAYAAAARAFRDAAITYWLKGYADEATIAQHLGRGCESEATLYREEPVVDLHAAGAPYEPPAGCYLGMTVERDPRLMQAPSPEARLAELTGRAHALFFQYFGYHEPFSYVAGWAERVKRAGGAIQLAWEPSRGLGAVRDGPALVAFARGAAATGMPVFLRFASEMNQVNTSDYPWANRPEEFVKAWVTVATVMRREAPNVALVWAPAALRQIHIPEYYPGDKWVDWVGLDLYTAHHLNGDPQTPSLREDFSDALELVYNHYADRKPLMICEGAASHWCGVEQVDVSAFASDKLEQLYTALPRRFPRVKAVCWFDVNTREAGTDVQPERRSADYSLTNSPSLLAAYRRVVSSPYFLSQVVTDGRLARGVRYRRVAAGQAVQGVLRLSAVVHTWVDRPTVVWRLDGRDQGASAQRPYEAEWDTTGAANGPHELEFLVVAGGQLVTRTTVQVTVANPAR